MSLEQTQEGIYGIDAAALDRLVLEISDLLEEAKTLLSEFDDTFIGAMNFLECDFKEKLNEVHKLNKDNFPTFERNIHNYIDDLLAVKREWNKGATDAALQLLLETNKNQNY